MHNQTLCEIFERYIIERKYKPSTTIDARNRLHAVEDWLDVPLSEIDSIDARYHELSETRGMERADSIIRLVRRLIAFADASHPAAQSTVTRTKTNSHVNTAYGAEKVWLSPAKARERNREILQVAMLEAEAPKYIKDITFAAFAEIYIEKHAKPRKKTWKNDQNQINYYLLPLFAKSRLIDIDRHQLVALHAKLGEHAIYAANRVVELLSAMFKFAQELGYVTSGVNPASRIRAFRERSRDRWLTKDEVSKLMEAVMSLKSIPARNVILFLLLSGARKSSVLNLRWDAIDWEREEIRLSHKTEHITGKPFYLPMSTQLKALLMGIDRTNEWVFPSDRTLGGPSKKIDKAWELVKERSGIQDVRLHDCRRTVGSWLAQGGTNLHLIGAVLNQTTPHVTEIYARFQNENVREALEKHGAQMAALMPAVSTKRLAHDLDAVH